MLNCNNVRFHKKLSDCEASDCEAIADDLAPKTHEDVVPHEDNQKCLIEYTVLVCGPFVNRQRWNNFTPGNLPLYSMINVVKFSVWDLWVLN